MEVGAGPNPKLETRGPKEGRKPKSERGLIRQATALPERLLIRFSVFGFQGGLLGSRLHRPDSKAALSNGLR
jgi:hypothetical protein